MARYETEVEADSIDEALKKGEDNEINADFGEADDIEARPMCVETEDGKKHYDFFY